MNLGLYEKRMRNNYMNYRKNYIKKENGKMCGNLIMSKASKK